MVSVLMSVYIMCFIAQTEGDPAYDYEDAYDDDFDGEQGRF